MVSKRQLEAVYSSGEDEPLCACREMTALTRTVTAKRLTHLSPAIAYSTVTGLYTHMCAWEHLPFHTVLPEVYFELHSNGVKKQ